MLAAGTAAVGLLAILHTAPRAQPAAGAAAAPAAEAPSRVEIVQTAEGYQLLRNGEPYFVRGAGGQVHLGKLKAAGGNSIRTWGVRDLGRVLDAAHAEGLTVTAGLSMGHERHGFNYSNPEAVARQLEAARTAVRRHRDHPALLMWGVGNEMEGRGTKPEIWRAVNDVARMIKKEDPNHPTMTIIAGAGEAKVRAVKEQAPDIDIIGINIYGSLQALPERMKKFGWTKPYMVTEFGPRGHWTAPKTEWGAPLEQSSAEKGQMYRLAYENGIASAKGWCLGSYAFLWGNKQETTATWYGMLLPDGTTLPPVDSMTYSWTGKWPSHRAPDVRRLEITTATGSKVGTEKVAAGTPLTATVQASSPNGYPLTVRWDLRDENVNRRSGGDFEEDPDAHPLPATTATTLNFPAPKKPGPYRLFAYVYDGKGKAGTVNIPFLVVDAGAAVSSAEPVQTAEASLESGL